MAAADSRRGPAGVALDLESILRAVNELLERARQTATKYRTNETDREQAAEIGSTREAAWLVARLCELLQTVLPEGAGCSADGQEGAEAIVTLQVFPKLRA